MSKGPWVDSRSPPVIFGRTSIAWWWLMKVWSNSLAITIYSMSTTGAMVLRNGRNIHIQQTWTNPQDFWTIYDSHPQKQRLAFLRSPCVVPVALWPSKLLEMLCLGSTGCGLSTNRRFNGGLWGMTHSRTHQCLKHWRLYKAVVFLFLLPIWSNVWPLISYLEDFNRAFGSWNPNEDGFGIWSYQFVGSEPRFD